MDEAAFERRFRDRVPDRWMSLLAGRVLDLEQTRAFVELAARYKVLGTPWKWSSLISLGLARSDAPLDALRDVLERLESILPATVASYLQDVPPPLVRESLHEPGFAAIVEKVVVGPDRGEALHRETRGVKLSGFQIRYLLLHVPPGDRLRFARDLWPRWTGTQASMVVRTFSAETALEGQRLFERSPSKSERASLEEPGYREVFGKVLDLLARPGVTRGPDIHRLLEGRRYSAIQLRELASCRHPEERWELVRPLPSLWNGEGDLSMLLTSVQSRSAREKLGELIEEAQEAHRGAPALP